MAKDEIRSQEWIDRIEELVRRAESISDVNARGTAIDLLRAVLDFHAAALERVMEFAAESGPAGQAIIERITTDDLTSSMLLLHDLHPDNTDTRVSRAVQKLDEMFMSLGARLSLIAIEPGTVRLYFASSQTWSRTAVTASIEKAILQAAPEIGNIVIEGLKESSPADFVPISDLLAGLHP
jgi:hypothetical protein